MSTTAVARPDGDARDLPAVSVLDDADRWSLQRLLDAHPYESCVVAARVAAAGSLRAATLGGEVLAVREPGSSDVRAACYVGGTVVPIGGDERDQLALGHAIARRTRRASELVGAADAMRALWEAVGPAWGPAREGRWNQPLLTTSRPPAVAPDPLVRPARPADLDAYVPAAAAMFVEELGVSPYRHGAEAAYRARLAGLVDGGRAYLRTGPGGEVLFKAEIGAVSNLTAQVQGVWVAPAWRRRGLATTALAAVVAAGLRLAPAVSLYVNDYNLPARTLYRRLGFQPAGTLATVLF